MFVPFESLPPSARIWIFQANRPLNEDEIKIAGERLRAFTDEWVVHGSAFDTSYSIQHKQFVILAADESRQGASGCSIDSSVRALKDLAAELQVDLFDRNLVAFFPEGKVVLYPLKDLKEKFTSGILNEATLTFNNLINTKQELESNWLIPAGTTWLKRYVLNALADAK